MNLTVGSMGDMVVTEIKENIGTWKTEFKHLISFIDSQATVYQGVYITGEQTQRDFIKGRRASFQVKVAGENGRPDLIRWIPSDAMAPEMVIPPLPKTGASSATPPPITLKAPYNREMMIQAQSAFRCAVDLAIHEGKDTSLDALYRRAKDIMVTYSELAQDVEQLLHDDFLERVQRQQNHQS